MPLRIDSYNQCQFDCAYCFAKSRGGQRGTRKFAAAPASALKARFKRIARHELKSSLDEFIGRRIPFQLGGMSDPFTRSEGSLKATHSLLEVLAAENYPTVINTKNAAVFQAGLIDLIRTGNFYVRFSISMLDVKTRSQFESSTSTPSQILKAVERLSNLGIAASVRFQPVFPDFEKQYLKAIGKLTSAGVKHASVEYLKIPVDAPQSDLARLDAIYSGGIYTRYKELGAKRIGRELVLPTSFKMPFLKEFKQAANKAGMGAGLADNEFLHLSDGGACCGGADLFLKGANVFDANPQGILRNKDIGDSVRFAELRKKWSPSFGISSYLNSKSRITGQGVRWLDYLKRDWNGDFGVYSPDFFYGVVDSGHRDRAGFKVYMVEDGF